MVEPVALQAPPTYRPGAQPGGRSGIFAAADGARNAQAELDATLARFLKT
ncbi:MAG: hypothetical protein IPH37_05695 [Burkholderiales bacterium]|nr:hypothetical protein [Burkholderiales bacterium]